MKIHSGSMEICPCDWQEERRLQEDRDDEYDGAPPKMRGKKRG
ncbi:MAG TPA: hypothetical protein VNP73_01425 [Actinomycetota bacterium]|nr:hypothetical protein [Actinomycetota bacterium]